MLPRKDLTKKQFAVLKFIAGQISNTNLPPTIREIAERFGFSSTGTVRDYLKALAEKGYIKILSKKSRAIELVRETVFSIPIAGAVHAGSPTLAVEDIEGYLELDKLIFTTDDIFALRVKGDSMIGRGIMHGDLVLVRRQNVGQIGEVVVALIGEEATVKTLSKKGNWFYLHPENPDYDDIPCNEDASIIGKVINVIRKDV